MPSNKPTLTVRIPEDIRKKLEDQADEENRSISNMLIVLLKDYFEQKENPVPKTPVKELEDVLTESEFHVFEQIKRLPLKERKSILKKLSQGD